MTEFYDSHENTSIDDIKIDIPRINEGFEGGFKIDPSLFDEEDK